MPRDSFHDDPSWHPASLDMAKALMTQDKSTRAAPHLFTNENPLAFDNMSFKPTNSWAKNTVFTTSPSDKPTWNHSDKVDYPWIRDCSTEAVFSTGNLHTGIMKDENSNAIEGGFAGMANTKHGFRVGAKPSTPKGSEVFAEVSAKLNKSTTAYGGMRRTDNSDGFQEGALYAGVSKDVNKNFSFGVRCDREVERHRAPQQVFSFWSLLKM